MSPATDAGTSIHEVAPDVFRLSTFIPDFGLQFNQFLVRDEAPLLFHTGMRSLFPVVRDAVSRLIDPTTLRFISFSHFEADESGALNEWLAPAPRAEAACSQVGALVSVNDFALRPARGLGQMEPSTESDILERVRAGFLALLEGLAALDPRVLLAMHGSTYVGDGRKAILQLADYGLRHLRSEAAAADLAQHVLVLAIEKLRTGQVREPERIASFVLSTARLVARDLRRATARHREDSTLLAEVIETMPAADAPPEPLDLEPGQSAHCTIRPEDDCNVLRLPLALRGIDRVDLDLVRVEADQETSRLHFEDVVLDREREEIVLLYPGDLLRQLPEHTFEIAVHAVDTQERRTLGRYTMFHSPWRG